MATNPATGDGIAAAPDLRGAEPHPLDCELDGYPWLPRMLDKARAHLAGTIGSYLFACPVDHTLMARLGVTPEVVLDLAARHADDRAVLAELREVHGVPAPADVWFDAPAVEDEMQGDGPYLRVRHRDQLAEQPGGRVFAGAEHGASVSVVLVEAAPGESEPAHTHATEEVVAVVEGAGTFFLGEHQARTVRAGEVVRIPAGVVHRWENRGDGPLRMVGALAAAQP